MAKTNFEDNEILYANDLNGLGQAINLNITRLNSYNKRIENLEKKVDSLKTEAEETNYDIATNSDIDKIFE